ncbi:MAG: aminoacyl-tRNA hydrolase [bacterium]|nr:aminoacyl-tRNA hydrolase [bacterium]
MPKFKLIAGLGNPGKEYEGTRHNIGFSVLDRLLCGVEWKNEAGCLRSEIRIAGEKVVLIKPSTFMNRSGEPLLAAMNYYKYTASDVVIIHDDIDLELGVLRIREGGSDGGQKGVRSIITSLDTPNFVRIRMGVGRPSNLQMEISDWVLQKFSKEESVVLEKMIEKATQSIEVLFQDGVVVAQQKFSN